MRGMTGATGHVFGQLDGLASCVEADLQIPTDLEQVQIGKNFEGYSQAEQVEKLASVLNGIEGLKFDNWEGLTFDERLQVLQEIENQAAALGGRAPLQVTAHDYGEQGSIFTAGQMSWNTKEILINEKILKQNSLQAEGNVLDTVLHEGRHAYQFSNLYEKRTEPSNEKYQSWVMNQKTGYLTCERFGFERYSMQPLELDARVIAEEVRANVSYR